MGLLAHVDAYRVVADVTLLYFDDCPNWRTAADLIERLAREHQDVTVPYRIVNTDSEAQRLGFVGSPTWEQLTAAVQRPSPDVGAT
jgi:hypothetical protein